MSTPKKVILALFFLLLSVVGAFAWMTFPRGHPAYEGDRYRLSTLGRLLDDWYQRHDMTESGSPLTFMEALRKLFTTKDDEGHSVLPEKFLYGIVEFSYETENSNDESAWESILFTGPANLGKACELMNSSGEDRCIVFTYSRHWIGKYQKGDEPVIVALISGEEEARAYTLSELADEFPDTDFARNVEWGTLNLETVYGMPPFQHVLPE